MLHTDEPSFILSDLALARRLEKAEAYSNVSFVEARASLFPQSGAEWIEVASTYAMYDGVSSPLTQTFGLGIFQPITSTEIKIIEDFYKDHHAPIFHEVSPLADSTLLALLNERSYQPIEFTSVMFKQIHSYSQSTQSHNEKIEVRLARDGEHELWAQTAAKGWSEFTELAAFMLELGQISAARKDALSFFAELEGKPIATGALSICDGVALLAGASTIPEARNRGAQQALLDTRLRYAASQGCVIAMICAQPGSGSQRNAERHGFRIAYTRIKWRLTSTLT